MATLLVGTVTGDAIWLSQSLFANCPEKYRRTFIAETCQITGRQWRGFNVRKTLGMGVDKKGKPSVMEADTGESDC